MTQLQNDALLFNRRAASSYSAEVSPDTVAGGCAVGSELVDVVHGHMDFLARRLLPEMIPQRWMATDHLTTDRSYSLIELGCPFVK